MIVAVTGGKGGVGKSVVSFNLGRELDGVVVDGDLTAPDLPRGHGPNIHDVLAGRVDGTEAVETFSTVPVLPGGDSLAGARAAQLDEFEPLVESLRRQYGWVVVDCPPGLARDVGYMLDSADVAVIVTNPDRAALQSAHETRELADRLSTPVAAVVLNRASKESHAELREDIESTLGAPVTPLPRRLEVSDAQEQAVPLRERYPDSPVCRQFAALAAELDESRDRIEEYASG
jgi:septum site-determining protein MinD